jgi:hypothetical protein
MFGITVSGGTRAGWRRVKEARMLADWVCSSCGARLRYFWTACPNCKNPRP